MTEGIHCSLKNWDKANLITLDYIGPVSGILLWAARGISVSSRVYSRVGLKGEHAGGNFHACFQRGLERESSVENKMAAKLAAKAVQVTVG